ncbi:MAG: hypothetical protein DRQ47_03515 [Gammaproteobacteria bacterium]|nr:MAG: hypothetical protein DRQ47_03515 [Gammaproteobacteria bacterium]
MAISGISVQPNAQYVPRSVDSSEKPLKNEQQNSQAVSSEKASQAVNQESRFPAISPSAENNKTATSRRDLTELETLTNSFRLQREASKPNGELDKALQSFIDVADFEHKDELASSIGIDIFV